ncbi:replication protein a 32 kda subunit-like [Plakobranchus ocellatus]|uniref:Replication protein a 32 kDa subunit-like n=1 Tax=Plakobranchus ocellatus TaxID=259542 RepID=A0AAV4ACM0_9GAST|nr:replication protein a 32 kda subunit-like [Plakobranchus ocellatus]
MWNNQDFNQSGFSQAQGGGFNTPQGDEKKKSKRSNNIVPVTVAQILTAKHEDDVFMSGHQELSQVTLVGLIKSVNESPTRIDYVIDDMTGPPLDVRRFNDSDENEEMEAPTSNAYPPNTYVRINGLLRAFGGKRTVNAFKITPLTDMNELTCHMLEVIHASATSQQQLQMPATGGQTSMGTSGMDMGEQIAGLSPLQMQVQTIIRSDQSERGCSIDEICQQLRSVAPKAIRDAIEFLSSEGHIYSTVDDEHFQATDA